MIFHRRLTNQSDGTPAIPFCICQHIAEVVAKLVVLAALLYWMGLKNA
jgi:hypothetical protein